MITSPAYLMNPLPSVLKEWKHSLTWCGIEEGSLCLSARPHTPSAHEPNLITPTTGGVEAEGIAMMADPWLRFPEECM